MPIPAISSSRQVPLAHLVPGPNAWREKHFKTDDLEASLERAPLMAPLIVRAVAGSRSKLEIVAGHRRYAALKARGWTHAEVRVVATDDRTTEMLSLEENLRRRAIKNEPKALARLLELYKEVYPERTGRPRKSVQDGRAKITALQALAKLSGKSVREVRRLARIGRGSKELQELYADGKINILDAERLVTLPHHKQQHELRLLRMPKVNAHGRALDALRYTLKQFTEEKPQGRVRREALGLLAKIKKAAR